MPKPPKSWEKPERPERPEKPEGEDEEKPERPERPEAPIGRVRSRSSSRRYRASMPRGPDRAEEAWPGPQEGDDKDNLFLVDVHTGRARLEDSADDWSPDDRPYMYQPTPDYRQQAQEDQSQEDDQTAEEADDESDDGGSPPRSEMIRRPRRRENTRAILTSNADNMDSSITRPPIGKGTGERSRQRVQPKTRSRSRTKSRSDSDSSDDSSDKRPPLPRPRVREQSKEFEGKRRRIQERSETPLRRRLSGKQKDPKGKGYAQSRPKGKDKSFGKVKNKFQGQGKGKSSKMKPSNIDDPALLSPAVRVFHETISDINMDEGCLWKKEVFKHYRILENANSRTWCMNLCTQHVRDILRKEKNKRLFIGPGRDGSSNDKVSVDVKFNTTATTPNNPVNKYLKAQGYVKSSFGYVQDKVTKTETWSVIEDQVDLDSNKHFTDAYEQLVIIIHPMFSTAESDGKKASDAKKTKSATTVASSSTRPPEGSLPAPAVNEEAVAEIGRDDSPNQEQVDKYLEEDADFSPLPPLEEKKIDQADL